jgi:hypothetical protein
MRSTLRAIASVLAVQLQLQVYACSSKAEAAATQHTVPGHHTDQQVSATGVPLGTSVALGNEATAGASVAADMLLQHKSSNNYCV